MVKRREPATRHKSDEEYNSFIEAAEPSNKPEPKEKPELDTKRSKQITLMISEYEADQLNRASQASGVNRSTFIRMSAMNAARDVLE